MQLTFTIKEGATNTDIAHHLRHQANLIEGIEPKMAAALTGRPDEEKSTSSKKKASAHPTEDYEESYDGDVEEADADEQEEIAPPPKKKAKKLTAKEVNQAAMAHAKEYGLKKTKTVLQKFGSASISEIDEDQWPALVKALAV